MDRLQHGRCLSGTGCAGDSEDGGRKGRHLFNLLICPPVGVGFGSIPLCSRNAYRYAIVYRIVLRKCVPFYTEHFLLMPNIGQRITRFQSVVVLVNSGDAKPRSAFSEKKGENQYDSRD